MDGRTRSTCTDVYARFARAVGPGPWLAGPWAPEGPFFWGPGVGIPVGPAGTSALSPRFLWALETFFPWTLSGAPPPLGPGCETFPWALEGTFWCGRRSPGPCLGLWRQHALGPSGCPYKYTNKNICSTYVQPPNAFTSQMHQFYTTNPILQVPKPRTLKTHNFGL